MWIGIIIAAVVVGAIGAIIWFVKSSIGKIN
jgi:hypothetical protein